MSNVSFATCIGRMPNAKVSERSQPPMTFDLSLSESAGSGSLHRLFGMVLIHSLPPCWRNNSAKSWYLRNTAMPKGVLPVLSLALTSAWLASSNSTTPL